MKFELLLKLCNQQFQYNYLQRMVKLGATGWTAESHPEVSHLEIDNPQLLAILEVIARAI